MMISPGTPRIHRSRGTMLASFLLAALCGAAGHSHGRAQPSCMKSGFRKCRAGITDDRAVMVLSTS